MDNKIINIGVLGFAHGHIGSIMGQWREHPEYGVRVVAGWDHDTQRLKSQAEASGFDAYEQLDELLGRSDIEAVIITSETSYHCELAEKAADAGKSIIMYKPMALTMAEADRIVAAVERNNVRFTMGYQMRVDPQNIKMKELVSDKVIGDTYLFRRRHSLATHRWENFDKAWHTNPALNRDIFADDSAHPIDMLNWMFGVPETVSCEQSTMHNPKVVNDVGVALFKYSNGLIAEISCCFVCSAAEITTEIYGSDGAVAQYYGDAVSAALPRPAGQPGLKWYINGDADWTDSGIASPKAHGERIGGQAKPFAEFLHGERGPICSVTEARASLRMVLACYLSSREGKRVRIDDPRVYEI